MADATDKQPWSEPAVTPLTDTDSRADVADQPVSNGTPNISQPSN